MTHRGSFTLDGAGVGDTADCRLTLPLASDMVWQLNAWACTIEGTTDYTLGTLEIYFAPSSTEFGASTQLNFPLALSDPIDMIGSTTYMTLIPAMGNITPGGSTTYMSGYTAPTSFVGYNDVSGGADPVIWVSSGTGTNPASGTMRFAVQWLGYTLDQILEPALFAGHNARM